MGAIPATCLECGQILAYDGARCIYYCPDCEARKPGTMKAEEMKKAA